MGVGYIGMFYTLNKEHVTHTASMCILVQILIIVYLKLGFYTDNLVALGVKNRQDEILSL